jgi:hypothetical protein
MGDLVLLWEAEFLGKTLLLLLAKRLTRTLLTSCCCALLCLPARMVNYSVLWHFFSCGLLGRNISGRSPGIRQIVFCLLKPGVFCEFLASNAAASLSIHCSNSSIGSQSI